MDNTRDFTEAETIARVKNSPAPEVGPAEVNEGDMVAGYRVESMIGKGGMGKVFRVRDEMTGKVAALKVLILDESMGERDRKSQIERFTNEAQIMWQLSDEKIPCVPLIYHMPKEPLGIIMEYLSGTPLDNMLNQYVEDAQKDLRTRALVEMLSTVAFALHKAHGLGIIHRDLKPSNILIRDYKDFSAPLQPVLVDFGIAKNPDRHLTESQTMMGTPAYMSPEQLMGKTDEVTAASDIFSMGLVLFRILAGEEFYKGLVSDGLPIFERVMGMLNVIKNSDTDGVDRIGKRLEVISAEYRPVIRRCLAYDPQNRYRTMDELAKAMISLSDVYTEANFSLLTANTKNKLPPPPDDAGSQISITLDSTKDLKVNTLNYVEPSDVASSKQMISKKYFIIGAVAVGLIIGVIFLSMGLKGSNKTEEKSTVEKNTDKKGIVSSNKSPTPSLKSSCGILDNADSFLSCVIKESNFELGEKWLEMIGKTADEICFSNEKAAGQEENCLKLYDLVFKATLKSCAKTKAGDMALSCFDKAASTSLKPELLQYLVLLEGYHRFCHGASDKKLRASFKACTAYENAFAIKGPRSMKPLIKNLEHLCQKEKSPTDQMECMRKQVSLSYKNPEIIHAGLAYLKVIFCFSGPKYKRAALSACKWMTKHIEKARKSADPYRDRRAALRD
ncbi:serine/threonine protein kinase [Myxococcota bacterium]|nr:serine/threonine protein kinase [Myxococcota bacterium]MBU1380716.1 serine/threonine protein kinase [Myxococcota bacterium]MBU1498056.1 serine/threonine protein kinase [Myxococcota bacterium]